MNFELNNNFFLWKVFKHDSSEFSIVEVCNCSWDKYMKLTSEHTTGIKRLRTQLMVIPGKTFSISLCSIPVHWETDEIPFLKWCRPGYPFMALNRLLSSFSPIICMHHWMRWSLKMPLCRWWSRPDVKQLKMSQWGKLAQKGLYIAHKPCFLNSGGLCLADACLKILVFLSCCENEFPGDFLDLWD